MLNPRLVNQSDLTQKAVQIWPPLYKVEKDLTNFNYLIRKVGTPFTQCVHRIRLRPIVPQTRIDDIDTLTTKFVADPSLSKFRPNNNQWGYQNYQQKTNRQKIPRNRNLQWQFALQTSPQQFYQNQFPAPNQYNQQTSQSQFSEKNPQASQTFQTTDQSFHYPYVQPAPKICFKCGYPNHLAKDCQTSSNQNANQYKSETLPFPMQKN